MAMLLIMQSDVTSNTDGERAGLRMASAQWASLGVEMDKSPGGQFLDILCCKKMFLRQI